jgi:ribosomal-protein-alanine N-acetyltransferase
VQVIETGRLILRRLHEGDAPFIFDLVNDPAWLRYIGDKGVRTLDDARAYVRNGPVAMYTQHGFGLYCVELKSTGMPIGVCGLLKRDMLPDVDIGFAFLPAFRSQGYARESAAATLDYARQKLNFERVVAIVSPDNQDSAKLLEKIGLRLERALQLAEDAETVNLFAIDFEQASVAGSPGG